MEKALFKRFWICVFAATVCIGSYFAVEHWQGQPDRVMDRLLDALKASDTDSLLALSHPAEVQANHWTNESFSRFFRSSTSLISWKESGLASLKMPILEDGSSVIYLLYFHGVPQVASEGRPIMVHLVRDENNVWRADIGTMLLALALTDPVSNCRPLSEEMRLQNLLNAYDKCGISIVYTLNNSVLTRQRIASAIENRTGTKLLRQPFDVVGSYFASQSKQRL